LWVGDWKSKTEILFFMVGENKKKRLALAHKAYLNLQIQSVFYEEPERFLITYIIFTFYFYKYISILRIFY